MPHFSPSGHDTYICQKCATVYDCVDYPPTWRPDITGHKSAGNVCPDCLRKYETSNFIPTSLYEHCKQESGLTDPKKIKEYMNRYYGHD